MDEQIDLQGLDEGARALVQRLLADIKHKQALLDKLTYEMALLKRLKFAAKTEALHAEQRKLLEDDLEEDLQAVHEEVESLKSEAERAPRPQPKRQSLPAQLPRQEFKHEPEVTECCNAPMRRIGEDVAEKLDYTPGVFTVHRHVRGKWVCACCQTLKQAPVDAHIIDKGIPTSGLLAQVLVAKYANHLPLFRQEAIYARAGVPLPRSTLAQWVGSCGVQLQPLVDALRQEVLARWQDAPGLPVGLHVGAARRHEGRGLRLLRKPGGQACQRVPQELERHAAGGRLCGLQAAHG